MSEVVVDETREFEWAVRWGGPNSPREVTGNKPPWAVDYARWKRSRNPEVLRRSTLTRVTTEVIEADWETVEA